MSRIAAVILALLFMAPTVAREPLHALAAQTLDGQNLVVPDDFPDRPALLIVGFTRASRAETSAWSRKVAEDGLLREAAAVYQVAIIEDVPKLMRRFVIGNIRRDVPESLHGRFVLVTQGSDAWRDLVAYADPDAAYMVLLDRQREIVWRGGGEVDDAAFQALQSVVAGLQENP